MVCLWTPRQNLKSLHKSSNVKGSGCKHVLLCEDALGLTLTWIHIPVYHVMLMLMFALSHTTQALSVPQGWQVLPPKCIQVGHHGKVLLIKFPLLSISCICQLDDVHGCI